MIATIKDISKKAKVSITTVSLVLNNKEVRVSDKKRQAILDIAKEMNYRPNQVAISLVSKKSKTIGLIIPSIDNIFFSELAKNLSRILESRDYGVLLCVTDDHIDDDIKKMELLRAKGVDGIVACFSDSSNEVLTEEIDRLKRNNIMFVLLDRDVPASNCFCVGIDNVYGGYIATTHLLENNHKRIACITGHDKTVSSQNRLQGYKNALIEYGVPFDKNLIFPGDFKFDCGQQQGHKLLTTTDATAVFAFNDMTALGLYRAAKNLNKKIGQDISIVGFDNIMYSSMLDVPLTSINQNVEEVAQMTASLMFDLLDNKKGDPLRKTTKPSLVIRDSVARLPD